MINKFNFLCKISEFLFKLLRYCVVCDSNFGQDKQWWLTPWRAGPCLNTEKRQHVSFSEYLTNQQVYTPLTYRTRVQAVSEQSSSLSELLLIIDLSSFEKTSTSSLLLSTVIAVWRCIDLQAQDLHTAQHNQTGILCSLDSPNLNSKFLRFYVPYYTY